MESSKPTCPLCRTPFDEYYHNPRVVPICGHTFCERCVENGISYRANRKVFVCGECKAEVHLRRPLAQELPTNQGVLEISRQSRQKDITSAKNCASHGKPLELTCQTCGSERVCAHCALFGDHKGHAVFEGNRLQEKEAAITNYLQVKQLIEKHILPSSSENLKLKLQKKLADGLRKQLTTHFQQLVSVLEKKEMDLLKELEDIKADEETEALVNAIMDKLLVEYDEISQCYHNGRMKEVQSKAEEFMNDIGKALAEGSERVVQLTDYVAKRLNSDAGVVRIIDSGMTLRKMLQDKEEYESMGKSVTQRITLNTRQIAQIRQQRGPQSPPFSPTAQANRLKSDRLATEPNPAKSRDPTKDTPGVNSPRNQKKNSVHIEADRKPQPFQKDTHPRSNAVSKQSPRGISVRNSPEGKPFGRSDPQQPQPNTPLYSNNHKVININGGSSSRRVEPKPGPNNFDLNGLDQGVSSESAEKKRKDLYGSNRHYPSDSDGLDEQSSGDFMNSRDSSNEDHLENGDIDSKEQLPEQSHEQHNMELYISSFNFSMGSEVNSKHEEYDNCELLSPQKDRNPQAFQEEFPAHLPKGLADDMKRGRLSPIRKVDSREATKKVEVPEKNAPTPTNPGYFRHNAPPKNNRLTIPEAKTVERPSTNNAQVPGRNAQAGRSTQTNAYMNSHFPGKHSQASHSPQAGKTLQPTKTSQTMDNFRPTTKIDNQNLRNSQRLSSQEQQGRPTSSRTQGLRYGKMTREIPLALRDKYHSVLELVDRQRANLVLDLAGLEMGDIVLHHVLDYLEKNGLKFQSMKLIKNSISDEGFRLLLGFLMGNDVTEILNMTSNPLTKKSFESILEFLKENSILRIMNLSNNKLSAHVRPYRQKFQEYQLQITL